MARVHISGSGTIGAPLIHLFNRYGSDLGFEAVTFTKATPRRSDLPLVEKLQHVGGRFAVPAAQTKEFEAEGFRVDETLEEAIEATTVLIEATPSGIALEKKAAYEQLEGPKGFLAQGSEAGFGTPYAAGVNDEVLDADEGRFVHIVSCNTHNIAALVRAIALADDGPGLDSGRVVCIRRGTDVGQLGKAPLAPEVGGHEDPIAGTHHAVDVIELYRTKGVELDLFSSAIKVPTQYMHTLWFNFTLSRETTQDEVLARLGADKFIATSDKKTSNMVFNVGREFGPFGRLVNQGVVATPTLHVHGREVTGFCFTPQDGNALLSNLYASTRFAHPDDWLKRVEVLDELIWGEV